MGLGELHQGEEKQKGKISTSCCHSTCITLPNIYFQACLQRPAQPCLKNRQRQRCPVLAGSSHHAGLAGAGDRQHASVWLWSWAVTGGEGALQLASFHPGRSGLGVGKQNKEGFCAGMQPPPQPPQGPGWRGVMLTPPRGSRGCSGITQQHSAPSAAAEDQPRGNFLAQRRNRDNHAFSPFRAEMCSIHSRANGPCSTQPMSRYYLPHYLLPIEDDSKYCQKYSLTSSKSEPGAVAVTLYSLH